MEVFYSTLRYENLLCWRYIIDDISFWTGLAVVNLKYKKKIKQILQFATKKNPGLRGLLRVGDDILT